MDIQVAKVKKTINDITSWHTQNINNILTNWNKCETPQEAVDYVIKWTMEKEDIWHPKVHIDEEASDKIKAVYIDYKEEWKRFLVKYEDFRGKVDLDVMHDMLKFCMSVINEDHACFLESPYGTEQERLYRHYISNHAV